MAAASIQEMCSYPGCDKTRALVHLNDLNDNIWPAKKVCNMHILCAKTLAYLTSALDSKTPLQEQKQILIRAKESLVGDIPEIAEVVNAACNLRPFEITSVAAVYFQYVMDVGNLILRYIVLFTDDLDIMEAAALKLMRIKPHYMSMLIMLLVNKSALEESPERTEDQARRIYDIYHSILPDLYDFALKHSLRFFKVFEHKFHVYWYQIMKNVEAIFGATDGAHLDVKKRYLEQLLYNTGITCNDIIEYSNGQAVAEKEYNLLLMDMDQNPLVKSAY